MADRRVKLVYPPALVDEPILYQLIRQYGVQTNIRRADVDDTGGWLLVDLRGDVSSIEEALDWVRGLGIEVQEPAHP